jgi:large subunit ribosomal protein L32
MAVPKKKHSKQRTRTRHSAWLLVQRKKLGNLINVVSCPSCKADIPERTACPACGKYKGRQIIKKDTQSDISVISA